MYTLSFTETELNVIVNSIGQRPYVEVFQLISKIQSDVTLQRESESNIGKFEFSFPESDLNLIINSVGQRPYVEVFQLIANIQNQIVEFNKTQVESVSNEQDE